MAILNEEYESSDIYEEDDAEYAYYYDDDDDDDDDDDEIVYEDIETIINPDGIDLSHKYHIVYENDYSDSDYMTEAEQLEAQRIAELDELMEYGLADYDDPEHYIG